MRIKSRYIISALLVIILVAGVNAQPSGGPYGPVNKSYEIPKTSGEIYYVAVDGKAESSGHSIENPTTIENAISNVVTGDVIIMRGGIYRTGDLYLNQGITIQPYKNEKPVVKGTYIADKWIQQGNGLWVTKWNRLFPEKPQDWWRRNREGAKTPQHRFNNDMVFADGKFLQSAGWEGELDDNYYYIDYESGLVYISFDPTDKLMEITAFEGGLIRTTRDVHGKSSDKRGPVVRGIAFTQYAYRAVEIEGYYPEALSNETDHGKDVIGTTFENCTITFCSRVAGYFKGDSLKIKNCKVSDTSTEGIYIIASSDVLLEKNIFTRNNIERITGYYPAAVKIFNQSYRVTCNDNLVIDLPYSNGIWYDVGNVDGVFTNNWIENVGHNDYKIRTNHLWPSDNGFFFEISKGAVCAGNVFVNCDHGLMILNSSDVRMYNNTFINSISAIGRNERSAQGDHFGWHPSTGPDVDERDGHVFVNNLMTSTKDFNRPLLFVWQSPVICETITNQQFKQLDHNIYVSAGDRNIVPSILWGPVKNEICQVSFNTVSDLNSSFNEFGVNSRLFNCYEGPLFKSLELGNFQVLKSFKGIEYGMRMPSEVRKLLPMNKQADIYVGAYPPEM
ncbi:MAG: right-handed parallel beta-helix repeat-containing protein [Melioribacteraceae bacterium]|nr:right-handed parallel beta-helix repeat-containing protein [Melioribacteraceae bacterium]